MTGTLEARAQRPAGYWAERAFIPLIFGGIVYAFWFLYTEGYFPQPFFYEPSGTFMDWFSMAYWARHPEGTYDSLGAIYPPLSFLIMKWLGDDDCYLTQGEPNRDCDWFGIAALHGIFVLNILLIAWAFWKIDKRTALPRSIALSAGLPMLFALERGNILILTLTFVLLAYGPIVRSARLRWIMAGLAVNLKVYLVAVILAPLLRRRWRAVEGAVIATVVLYLLSWAIYGYGSPAEFLTALSAYSSGIGAQTPLDLWYPITYIPLLSLLEGRNFPITAFIDSRTVELLQLYVPIYVNIGRAMILGAIIATWLRPEAVPFHRILYLALAFALINSEGGGYTQILLLFFVFQERWRGFARPAALIIAYVLCVPGEYVIAQAPGVIREGYLSGRSVTAIYGVGVMSLLRPGLIELMAILLSGVTIRDVWLDIRRQGWRGRWRFRRDVPMLPGIARPNPPESA